MWRSLKALDLRRDPRFSLHSGSVDPPEWRGDAKIAGRAVEVHEDEVKRAVASASDGEEQSGPYHLYRADLHEVTIVRLGEPADHLVIEWWREGDGLRRKQRR
jgi:hypothetical protein